MAIPGPCWRWCSLYAPPPSTFVAQLPPGWNPQVMPVVNFALPPPPPSLLPPPPGVVYQQPGAASPPPASVRSRHDAKEDVWPPSL